MRSTLRSTTALALISTSAGLWQMAQADCPAGIAFSMTSLQKQPLVVPSVGYQVTINFSDDHAGTSAFGAFTTPLGCFGKGCTWYNAGSSTVAISGGGTVTVDHSKALFRPGLDHEGVEISFDYDGCKYSCDLISDIGTIPLPDAGGVYLETIDSCSFGMANIHSVSQDEANKEAQEQAEYCEVLKEKC